MSSEKFLTSKDLAAQLKVTRAHILAMAKRGELPRGLRFGRCVRWDAATIDNWLDGLRGQASA